MKAINGNTRNKYARNLIKAVMAVAQHQIDAGNAFVPSSEVEITEPKDMSTVLSKYRAAYVTVTRADGSTSLDKGDEVAVMLRDLTLGEVLAMADIATGSTFGTHQIKYEGLNVGSQRMNAGNRIRAVVKKGIATVAGLVENLAEASEFGDLDELDI